ncbi:hypothetical protein AAFF_G00396940 [Aldrovandia affinis]|uniref:Uncharacterized protein n=1 Tax=Aldrovandia affinis TaxID=143900 RepID=A0AAD7SF89_9TELE|nr:hypothetical protein AAFF_G00396940 [Aldrovandia affinis]
MNWLLLQNSAVLLLYTVGFYISRNPASPQGHFPRLENIAAYKTVTTVPAGSTCGIPERNAFCRSSVAQEGLLTCRQQLCVQECPYRTAAPPFTDLFSAGLGTCVAEDRTDLRPGSPFASSSLVFRNRTDCFTSPPVQDLGPVGAFTLTVWLKPKQAAVMTVIEKSAEGRPVFLLAVSEEEVQLHYRLQQGQTLSLSTRTPGRLSVGHWTHLALQVHGTSVSLFLDGLEEDGTAFDTQALVGPISDLSTDMALRIGQSFNGSNQFMGRMQDFRFYPMTLTNREIVEVFSGSLPHLHTQSECRCPPSHPRVHPLVERYCIANGAEDTTNNRVLRLNLNAHPLSYINDNDIGTGWISSVFSGPEQLNNGITITFDLENGQYQVFYVILQFLGPQPEAVRIERRTSRRSEWRAWQYLARNCSVFGMADNGLLEAPDSVNCLQFPRVVPYSRGNLTFSVLTPEPNLRPGYNNFYNTPALQDFVEASQVRIHLRGQYHTQEPNVPLRHRYYGVDEVTISGRWVNERQRTCRNGPNADSSITGQPIPLGIEVQKGSTAPICCQCERCAPLFNDKPFREGDQLQAYGCRPCQCHGHASSCHYDITTDPFPGQHFRGGGGVCDHCQHNTTGRNCELCQSLFFREADTDLGAGDVCVTCGCHEEGTVNGSLDCHPIGGQCRCKRRVSGRQCNQCQHGFYKLQRSYPDGCRACNCNTAGTARADITCHHDSGQCQCKANVIGRTCDRCNFGFSFLNSTNADGCAPCGCNRNGSLHQFCNPFTGQCECRAQVRGLLCDVCVPRFYGLASTGACLPCACDPAGTLPGGLCDPSTGQCPCKVHTEGRRCQACRDGFHSLDRTNSLGCLPCQCDPLGSADTSGVCDKNSGRCPCKASVQGARCTRCAPHFYDLASGCRPCHCDTAGTVPGTVCDPASGQCVCLPARSGQRCSVCQPGDVIPGFFLYPLGESGCEACDCHPVGAAGNTCELETGQCTCAHPSLTGTKVRPLSGTAFRLQPQYRQATVGRRCQALGPRITYRTVPPGAVALTGSQGTSEKSVIGTGRICEWAHLARAAHRSSQRQGRPGFTGLWGTHLTVNAWEYSAMSQDLKVLALDETVL